MKKGFFMVIFFAFYSFTLVAQDADWNKSIDNKQYAKIIAEAADLQPADSIDFQKMFLLGQAYEGLLKYKNAYNCYKQCFALDSTHIEMLTMLARISGYLGRVTEAEKYYQMVLATDSAHFYANYQLARLYIAIERYHEALYHLELLLDNDPENTILLRTIGDCYKNLNFLGDALEYYRAAYHSNVENASLASLLVNTLLKAYSPIDNDFIFEAIAVCDTGLFYNPGHKTLRQNKAMAFFTLNDYVKSDSMYSALMVDRDSSYITLKYGGLARYYSRQWLGAIKPLEKAFKMDHTAVDVCIILGISLGRIYNTQEAFEYFDLAENLLEPDIYWSEKLLEFRAETYVRNKEGSKGAELYYQLWKKNEEKINWLQQMQRALTGRSLEQMSDEERQRYLYVNFLYTSELLKLPKSEISVREYAYLRSVLQKFEDEMFFRNVTSLPMLSLEKAKNTLSLEKLKELIAKLSE